MSLCSPSITRADAASDNTIYPLILLGMVHCKNVGYESDALSCAGLDKILNLSNIFLLTNELEFAMNLANLAIAS